MALAGSRRVCPVECLPVVGVSTICKSVLLDVLFQLERRLTSARLDMMRPMGAGGVFMESSGRRHAGAGRGGSYRFPDPNELFDQLFGMMRR